MPEPQPFTGSMRAVRGLVRMLRLHAAPKEPHDARLRARYHNDLFMREAQVPQLGFGDSHINYQLTTHMQYTQQFAAPFGSAPVVGDQSVPWLDEPNQFAHEQFQFQPRSQAMASNPDAAYMAPGRPFTPAYVQEPAPAPSSPAAALESIQQQPQTQKTQRHQQTAGSATAAGDADPHADDSGYSPTLVALGLHAAPVHCAAGLRQLLRHVPLRRRVRVRRVPDTQRARRVRRFCRS